MTAFNLSVKIPTEEYIETDVVERIEKTLETKPDVEVVELSTGTGLGEWGNGLSDVDIMVEAEPESSWVLEVVLTAGQPLTVSMLDDDDEGLTGDSLTDVKSTLGKPLVDLKNKVKGDSDG